MMVRLPTHICATRPQWVIGHLHTKREVMLSKRQLLVQPMTEMSSTWWHLYFEGSYSKASFTETERLSAAQWVVNVTPYRVTCDHKLSSWQPFSSNIWHIIYLPIMSIKLSTAVAPAVYITLLMQQPCRRTLGWNWYPPHIMPYSFILLYLLHTPMLMIPTYLSTAVDLAIYSILLMQQPCKQTLLSNWYLLHTKLC